MSDLIVIIKVSSLAILINTDRAKALLQTDFFYY